MAGKLVIIESPFAGDINMNVAYARAAVEDSIKRGEVPFASHLLYTQPGILDDDDPAQRRLGIETGWAMMRVADLVAVYTDKGISAGMQAGIRRAESLGLPVEHRELAVHSWDTHELPFPTPEDAPEPAATALQRVVRGIRVRWAMRTPVIVREAMLGLADQIEADEL